MSPTNRAVPLAGQLAARQPLVAGLPADGVARELGRQLEPFTQCEIRHRARSWICFLLCGQPRLIPGDERTREIASLPATPLAWSREAVKRAFRDGAADILLCSDPQPRGSTSSSEAHL